MNRKVFIRALSLLLVFLMCFSMLIACTTADPKSGKKDDKDDKDNEEQEELDPDENEDEDEDKVEDKEDEENVESSDEDESEDKDESEDEESESESESDTETNEASDPTDSESAESSDESTESNTTTESESESTDTESESVTKEGEILVWDGEAYKARFVRKELADAFALSFYNEIRALAKNKTKLNPSLATDFVAKGKELDDGPAILIGETDYPESKAVYKTLKDNQAKAVVSGNKYVIAYSNESAATLILEELTKLFKKASSTGIIIDSTWNKTVTVKGFDESSVKQSANFPSPSGFSWATSGRDVGQGSKMYIANNATLANFTSFCNSLKTAGFTPYATNDTLHTNRFATYVTKEQIVSVMFYEPKKVMKVVIDPRSTFGLPGTKADNVYAKPTAPTEFVQLGLKQISGAGENGMGYLVKLSNGKFVVVDGGFAYDSGGGGNSAKFILDTMKKMQGNSNKPVIAAYIVTHIHTDHAGGFMGFANSYANQVTIEKFIYNQPSDAQMNAVSNMGGRKSWLPNAINKLKNAGSLKSVIKAHPGMQIYLAELTITILGTIDVIEDSSHTKMKNGNDSSVVSMFEINGGKVLLTGDCEPQEGRIIRDIYGGIYNTNSPLKADFIQVAHHGYGNTNTDYIGCDQNALNVMASGGGTSAGSSPIYALVPVGLENGKDPAGYYDAVQGMHAMRIFSEDHRLVAYNKNLTIKFNTNGTHTIEKTKKGNFWIGTWSTY